MNELQREMTFTDLGIEKTYDITSDTGQLEISVTLDPANAPTTATSVDRIFHKFFGSLTASLSSVKNGQGSDSIFHQIPLSMLAAFMYSRRQDGVSVAWSQDGKLSGCTIVVDISSSALAINLDSENYLQLVIGGIDTGLSNRLEIRTYQAKGRTNHVTKYKPYDLRESINQKEFDDLKGVDYLIFDTEQEGFKSIELKFDNGASVSYDMKRIMCEQAMTNDASVSVDGIAKLPIGQFIVLPIGEIDYLDGNRVPRAIQLKFTKTGTDPYRFYGVTWEKLDVDDAEIALHNMRKY